MTLVLHHAADQALADLRRIRTAVDAARERASTEEPGFLRCSTWFTDNVVLATPVMRAQTLEMTVGPTFVDAAYMQLYLLGDGYLARGAISFGALYIDETFAFGPALIEAHELEEDNDGRRWPCVAVTDQVAELSREMARRYYDEPKHSPFPQELMVDEQGKVFVDHLGIWLDEEDDARVIDYWAPRYRDLIRRKLKEVPQGTPVWRKWRWLGDYHDYALRLRRQNRRHFVTGLRAEHGFTKFADTI